ncbi:DUF1127 domain-containing protein [Pseudomonas sp. JM0905a]|uniref:DUF1127 domain-containing protein n=1 Tax=Metapseudomonas resinovorans TaxID=53412 RepID=A0ABT4Y7C1_METRE|nr:MULTISPECIES: DUF1127 domain-containing protein [Pseudomonas]MBD2836443.1 DUF1127 domain-containing protein [Pseudomonas sp. JM0905a]MDA8484661.1 DUF1127 domain-containing protein [Pseudomonas resinovorans]
MKGQHGFIGTSHDARFNAAHHQEGWLAAAWHAIRRWEQLSYERDQLARMSDEMLKDIGLSRADVMEESDRHFWEDPLKK